jgi:branched-chain amino acid transport system permease protein
MEGHVFIVQTVLNCLVLGGLFFLIAIGLNIIYGISRVINVAHGSIYALGAYFGYTLVVTGVNFIFALILAPIMVAVVGILIDKIILEPTRDRPMVYTLILTYGLMVFMDGMLKYIWGDQIHFIQIPDFLSGSLTIAGVPYPFYRFFILIATAVVMASLYLLLEKTKTGIVMRAASTIPEMVYSLGIDMKLVHVGIFAFGCALAGLGGVIAGPLFSVYPMMGGEMLISCFVVLVVGGLGSIKGVTLAALLIGTVQTLGFVFITDYAMVIVYVMMAFILIFMPKGIMGEGKFE